jgi:hypothetical protein
MYNPFHQRLYIYKDIVSQSVILKIVLMSEWTLFLVGGSAWLLCLLGMNTVT